MKTTFKYIFFSILLICLSTCYQTELKITEIDTKIEWRSDDNLYQLLLNGKQKMKIFNNTDSTLVIDAAGEKALFKFNHNQGCVQHQYEVIIPSLAIRNNNYELPWIINHNHEHSFCEANVITRYSLDLKSLPITNDWKIKPPQVLNVSNADKLLIIKPIILQ